MTFIARSCPGRSRWLACVVWVALLGVGAPARAQMPDDAKVHYREATKLFDLGRYHEAAIEYAAAFERRDDAAFLFNQAQALRLAGEYSDSIRAYRSFLRREPKARNRSDIEARIADMQKLLAENVKQAPPQQLGTPLETPDPKPTAVVTPPVVAPVVTPPVVTPPVVSTPAVAPKPAVVEAQPVVAQPIVTPSLVVVEPPPSRPAPHRLKTGAVVGIVIGTVVVIAGIGVGLGIGLTREPSPPSSALGSYRVFP